MQSAKRTCLNYKNAAEVLVMVVAEMMRIACSIGIEENRTQSKYAYFGAEDK